MSQSVSVLENPTHWGLKTAKVFAKLVLDNFVVCLLEPIINLAHIQQSYVCPKNQNYLLEKPDLKFFHSYGLSTTIKITIFSTFYVIDNVSSRLVEICANNTDSFNKNFKVKKEIS